MILTTLVLLGYGFAFLAGLTHNPNWHPSRVEDDPRTVYDGHNGDW